MQEVEQMPNSAYYAEDLTASAEQTSAATGQVAIAIQEVAGSAEKQMTEVDKTLNPFLKFLRV